MLPGRRPAASLLTLHPVSPVISRRVTVLVLLALLTATLGCRAEEKAKYIEENDRILSAVPLYPSAEEVSRETSSYVFWEELGRPPDGYVTRVVYSIPENVSAEEVVQFYTDVAVPEGWRRLLYGQSVHFCSGDAEVQIALWDSGNRPGFDTFVVSADYQAKRTVSSRCHQPS